ncbi:MAG: hypothetical protein R3D89_09115 [Sphingomonadaceae bacterium]
MKKIVSFASAIVLGLTVAACGGSDEAAEDAAAPADDAAAAAADAPSGLTELPVGVAEMTKADGSKSTVTISADGAYEMQPAEGLAEAGIASVADGKLCFDPSGDAGATCWTASAPGEDGSYTATSDGGDTVTISPQADAAM